MKIDPLKLAKGEAFLAELTAQIQADCRALIENGIWVYDNRTAKRSDASMAARRRTVRTFAKKVRVPFVHATIDYPFLGRNVAVATIPKALEVVRAPLHVLSGEPVHALGTALDIVCGAGGHETQQVSDLGKDFVTFVFNDPLGNPHWHALLARCRAAAKERSHA